MKKRMLIMLVGLAILFGAIFGFQILKSKMIKKSILESSKQIVSISSTKVEYSLWESKIKASASLRAVEGVDITSEIAGLVSSIEFTPGAKVKKNTLLVKLNDTTEVAQLHSLEASAALARITYERDKAQYKVEAVSQQVVDNDAANLKSLLAQVEQQQSVIDKKRIRAPFTGQLGISNINLGQYINPGDKMVTLQSLDPIYADFYLPQQDLIKIAIGQKVEVTTDTYPHKRFIGKITTINPKVDPQTRNVQVEATIPNPEQKMLPGMYATVEVITGKPKPYLTLPQTAISYNPYGEVIYIIKEKGKDDKGNPILIANQSFVKVGAQRGDQVSVIEGLKEGDTVVISGQLKLKNGVQVKINNKVLPSNNPNPNLINK